MHAYRRDLADIALAGQLFAPHYARPLIKSCGVRSAFLYPAPSNQSEPASELLPGEEFAVLEFSGHWAWGYCRHDHYVGYIETIELADAPPPTHIIVTRDAAILPEPDPHVPALAALPMGARVTGREQEGFLATDTGFIAIAQLRAIGEHHHDPVSVAERLIGVPYVWGGRSARGIDCSGLVQLALALCGVPAPRDSDQQRALGGSLPDDAALQRGDLVFFEGHVGLMTDETALIHANRHSGDVAVEPLEQVCARTPILDRRRLG